MKFFLTHTPGEEPTTSPSPDFRALAMQALRKALLAGPGLFSRRCAACGGPGRSLAMGPPLCESCEEKLALRQGGYCPRCGLCFGEADAAPMVCASCRMASPAWTGFSFFAAYDGLLRQCILEYKFGSQPRHGGILGALFRRAYRRGLAWDGPGALDPAGPQVIAPVPLHPRRLRWRGFNQSLELARALKKEAPRAEIAPQALRRIRNTTPQSGLPGAKRRDNIKGAFRADPRTVAGRSVLLADDVMTTGATIEQAVLALLTAGAARVDVLVLAR